MIPKKVHKNPRITQKVPENPGATQKVPENPGATQKVPENPGATQKVPKIMVHPRITTPKTPQQAHNSQLSLRAPVALDHATCFKYNLCDP